MALDISKLQEENERLSGKGSANFLDQLILMPQGNGTVKTRVLPPQNGSNELFVATRIHKMNGRNIHCARKLSNGRWLGECSVCSYYSWLWKQADTLTADNRLDEAEAKKTEARSIKPNERYYYAAVDRAAPDDGPKILSVGKKLHKKIITAICGDLQMDEPALGDVSNVSTGRDLKIIKEVAGDGFPNYDRSRFDEPSALGSPDQVESWLENMPDLHSLRRVKTTEEMEKELRIHMGLEPDNSTGFDPQRIANGQTANVAQQETAANAFVNATTNTVVPQESPTPPVTEAEEPVAETEETEATDSIDKEAFMAELRDL